MVIYGKQLFLHLLGNHKKSIKKVYLAKECDKKIFNKIVSLGIEIARIDNKKAQALARGGNHQGFLAEVEDFKFYSFKEIKKFNLLAILCGLTDVGNIGAIIRTAYALGVDGIVIITQNLNGIEGIIRSSSGAIYNIPVAIESNILDVLNELKQLNFKVYATQKGGKSCSDINFKNNIAIIMGNEGDGIPKKVVDKCDDVIGIKFKNDWDSLNVNAAFAIICDRIING